MTQIKIPFLMFCTMTILTSVAYPLLITLVAQVSMPQQANGSLIHKQDRIIGSSLIAQPFTGQQYFWPRPSSIDYNPALSGGSNLGPTSKKLKETVIERVKKIQAITKGDAASIPSELVYASGSGLDPHISISAAYFQIPRIAKARSISEDQIKSVVDALRQGRQGAFKNSNYVNVLELNLAIDQKFVDKK